MLLIGLYLAGLILFLREFIPWFGAVTGGSIRTRGHKRERITRAADPERFRSLTRQRFKAMGLGAIALGIALGWTVWLVIGQVLSSMAEAAT